MRYHVIYRAAGEEETTHVEAEDAAAAVSAVTDINDRGPAAFELLSVVPEEHVMVDGETAPATTP